MNVPDFRASSMLLQFVIILLLSTSIVAARTPSFIVDISRNNDIRSNRKFAQSLKNMSARTNPEVVKDSKFILIDGTPMEVKFSLPKSNKSQPTQTDAKPLLLFVHGSFHSAWCWEHNFFPHFTALGYPCVALSLRGTSGTFAGEGVKKVKVDNHVNDVLYFLQCFASMNGRDDENKDIVSQNNNHGFMTEISQWSAPSIPPVIIAHSFGGLTAMKLLEHPALKESTRLLSSIALLCSVPPSGIKKMSLRKLRRNPIKGWRIIKGLAMKKSVTDPKLCRLLFFDALDKDEDGCDCEGVATDEDLGIYMERFQKDSRVTMDLVDMAKKLPILAADEDGTSLDIKRRILQYPAMVLGGTDDYIVDRDAIEETARFFGVEDAVIVKDAVHDVMLARCWKEVASKVEVWLDAIQRGGPSKFAQ